MQMTQLNPQKLSQPCSQVQLCNALYIAYYIIYLNLLIIQFRVSYLKSTNVPHLVTGSSLQEWRRKHIDLQANQSFLATFSVEDTWPWQESNYHGILISKFSWNPLWVCYSVGAQHNKHLKSKTLKSQVRGN